MRLGETSGHWFPRQLSINGACWEKLCRAETTGGEGESGGTSSASHVKLYPAAVYRASLGVVNALAVSLVSTKQLSPPPVLSEA
ncbi:hypothetical protein EYF80_032631 [Liparis tanakae]|uniref:Uncharacterized protein n=1 Tax=Liparis tanakae TaxID=230148 RepID=A0A4Z2GU54_9TELE|nr:hypothetical protein EYF80_032631 [Liparis tanakae]